LGRYLRIHYVDKLLPIAYWGGYFLCGAGLFLCQYVLSWLLGFEFTSWFSYNTVFVLIGSVSLFLAFKSIDILSRVINYWASPCLAVYIIHLHPDVWSIVTKEIGISSFHGMSFVAIILSIPIVLYFICSVIELFRSYTMQYVENRMYHTITQRIAT